MNRSSNSSKKHRPARHRGVALIMIAVLLTVVFVLAIAFVSASRMDRMAGRGHAIDDSADAAVDAASKYLGSLFTKDYQQETSGSIPAYTYPDANHKWLSTLDGRSNYDEGSGNGPWDVWPQISLVTDDFIDAGTLKPLPRKSDGTVDQTLRFGMDMRDSSTWGGLTADVMGDAGGSSVADARWVRLSLPGPEGIVWVALVRIIDNGAMVNVNTATQTTYYYGDYSSMSGNIPTRLMMPNVTGVNPAEIDLFGMMANVPFDQYGNGSAATRGVRSPFCRPEQANDEPMFSDPFAAAWTYYPRDYIDSYDPLTSRRLSVDVPGAGATGFLAAFNVGPVETETADGRKFLWQNVGSRLPVLLGVNYDPNSSPGSALSPATPYGFFDESELRLRFAANVSIMRVSSSWVNGGTMSDGTPYGGYISTWNWAQDITSALEWRVGMRGAYQSLIRSGRGWPNIHPTQIPVDYRHLITCYNGEAQTQNGAGGTYRGVMPNWVRSATGGTWRAKLDPNHDLGTDLATLFDGLLKATTTPGSSGGGSLNHYLGDTTGTEATKAAYSLAANLVAYRNAGHDPSDAMVGSYCGLEPQPFFVEATTAYVHKTDPTSTTTAAGVPLLLIELRNPFVNSKTPVNLSKFRLSVGTAATSTAANSFALPNYDLKPGEMVVLYTEGDDELVAFLDQVGVPATRRVAIPAQGVLPDPPVFCLYTNDQPKVMVDRLRNAVWDPNTKKLVANTTPSGRWAARNRGGTPVIQPGKWQITSSTLWRDTRASGPTGSVFGGGATGAPCYVIEALNNQVNKAASNSPVEVPPGAYVDPSQSGGPFGPAFLPGICGTAGRFSKPSATAPPALPGVFQLPIKDAPLDTLGELLLLPTVAHTTGASGRPFSEGMLERYQLVFANGAVAALIKDSYFGALWTNLDWTHYVRSSSPNLPVAVTLFDGLDILGPQTNVPILPGRININTAPAKVIARLPWMHRFTNMWKTQMDPDSWLSVDGFRGSDVMVAYRDMTELPGDAPWDPVGRTYKDRALCDIPDLSKIPGYRSIGEPLLVRRAMKDASLKDFTQQQIDSTLDWRMDKYGVDVKNEAPLPPDSWGQVGPCIEGTPDVVTDDVRELSLLFNKMSNLITIHSDTFTASVVLQGRRLNPATGKYVPVVTRRFVAGFDRSNLTSTNGSPKLLYLTVDRDYQPPIRIRNYSGYDTDALYH